MKLSNRTLKNIAVSAGISATIIGSASAASIAPSKKGEPGCVVPPIKIPVAPIPADRVVKKLGLKSAKDFFTIADVNKDGKLSAEEFNKAYLAIVAQEKAKAAQAKHPAPPMGPDGCPGCGLG